MEIQIAKILKTRDHGVIRDSDWWEKKKPWMAKTTDGFSFSSFDYGGTSQSQILANLTNVQGHEVWETPWTKQSKTREANCKVLNVV